MFSLCVSVVQPEFQWKTYCSPLNPSINTCSGWWIATNTYVFAFAVILGYLSHMSYSYISWYVSRKLLFSPQFNIWWVDCIHCYWISSFSLSVDIQLYLLYIIKPWSTVPMSIDTVLSSLGILILLKYGPNVHWYGPIVPRLLVYYQALKYGPIVHWHGPIVFKHLDTSRVVSHSPLTWYSLPQAHCICYWSTIVNDIVC